jgi:hypothetical protein
MERKAQGVVKKETNNLTVTADLYDNVPFQHCIGDIHAITVIKPERRATGWTAGVQFPAVARDPSLLYGVRPTLGHTQPPIRSVPVALSPRVRRQRRASKLSPSSSTEVKNGGTILPFHHTSSCRGASLLSTGTTLHNTVRKFYTSFCVE